MSAPLPKVIHQTWKSHDVPSKYADYVRSVKDCNPEFTYILWSDDDIDAYVKQKVPQYYAQYKSFATHIERVDFARYVIMYFYPAINVYMDLDVFCLKSFAPLVARNRVVLGYECSEHDILYGGPAIGNAVMVSPPGEQYWLDLMQHIVSNYRVYFWQNAIQRTGPGMMTNHYNNTWDRDKWDIQLLSSCAFYPMSDWFNKGNAIDGHDSISKDCRTLQHTYCIHKWAHAWCYDWVNVIAHHKVQCFNLLVIIVVLLVIVALYFLMHHYEMKTRSTPRSHHW